MNTMELRGLSKVFTQGKYEVRAVDNVTFDIARGELVSITGRSGSGKMTLLNLIGGIETATEGSVYIDGVDICRADEKELARLRRQKIGLCISGLQSDPYFDRRGKHHHAAAFGFKKGGSGGFQ